MANIFTIQHDVIDSDQYKQLTPSAKVLYTILCKLSNRYGNKNTDNWFGRSIHELAIDTGLSSRSITRAIKQLNTAYMVQTIVEPNYIRQISNRYRIIQWKRVKFKRRSYRQIVTSTYGQNGDSLNKNTNTLKSKLLPPDNNT